MKIFSATFLLSCVFVSSCTTSAAAQKKPTPQYPWVFECAVAGINTNTTALPPSGSRLERLLSCMVDVSVTDRFEEEELTFRDRDLHWCLPPSFLDRSCLSPQLDPYQYLVKCLFEYQILGSFYFYHNETQEGAVADPFADDNVVVAETLMRTMCTSIDGLRSTEGVSCLVEQCQTVSEAPSAVPTETPSISPTMAPSSSPSAYPSDFPSLAPSASPSDFPSLAPSAFPSDLPSLAPSAWPSPSPSLDSEEPSMGPTAVALTFEPTQFVEYPLRFPPLVLRMEIILKLEVINLADGLTMPPDQAFLNALALSFDNVLMSNVDGHVSVEILFIDPVADTNNLSVFLRAVAIRECIACSAGELADEMVDQYLDALKSASGSGSLSSQIEFHGFVHGFPTVMNITIDPDSVESLALSNKERLESEASVSAGVAPRFFLWISWMGLFMTAGLMM